MAQFETCEIRLVTVKAPRLFSSGSIYRWEAHKLTSSGSTPIYQSKDFRAIEIFIEEEWADFDDGDDFKEEYKKMIAQLTGEGWEVVSTNKVKYIRMMKRKVAEPFSLGKTLNPTDLLQQLVNLRDAGILTEQEFESKKTEILKRM